MGLLDSLSILGCCKITCLFLGLWGPKWRLWIWTSWAPLVLPSSSPWHASSLPCPCPVLPPSCLSPHHHSLLCCPVVQTSAEWWRTRIPLVLAKLSKLCTNTEGLQTCCMECLWHYGMFVPLCSRRGSMVTAQDLVLDFMEGPAQVHQGPAHPDLPKIHPSTIFWCQLMVCLLLLVCQTVGSKLCTMGVAAAMAASRSTSISHGLDWVARLKVVTVQLL